MFKQMITPCRFSVDFHVKLRKVGEIILLLQEPSAFILVAPVPFQVLPLSFQTQHHPMHTTEKRVVLATAAILF